MIPSRFVGDLLIRAGLIDKEAIARVVEAQPPNCATLGRALASLGLANESVVASTIATALKLEYFDGEAASIPADARKLLPADFCQKRRVIPLGMTNGVLRIAVADPMDDAVLQDVRFRSGKNIVAVVVTET